MDPNANLNELRAIAVRILTTLEAEGLPNDHIRDVERMAELVVALDSWITGGGFLPEAWHR